MRGILFLAVITLGYTACQSEYESPLDEEAYGYSYFPLSVGQSLTYLVDSIRFDYVGNSFQQDSSSFFLREDYVEKLKNQQGEDLYRIVRYKSRSLEGPWEVLDVVSEYRTLNQAFRTENNQKFNVLIFPPKVGQTWDGNAFINQDVEVFVKGERIKMFQYWAYEILPMAVPNAMIDEGAYQDLLIVQQADDENAFDLRRSHEYRAKGVGVVYRERWILESACKFLGTPEVCIDRNWPEKAGRGFIVREKLVAQQ